MIEFLDVAKPIATAGAGYLGKQLFEKPTIKKLLNFFKAKHKIIVLGSTGVGKTQFIHSFIENLQFVAIKNRTLFPRKLLTEILDKQIEFFDNPGEIAKSEERRQSFMETFNDKNYKGIINVVSYGYHETGYENEDIKNAETKAAFLTRHREIELQHLTEWLPTAFISQTKWIITLVNKADIWQANNKEVIEYYKNGEYAKAFENSRMTQRHIMLPYCATIQSFMHQKQQDFLFSDTEKYAMKQYFTENLIELLTAE